MPYSRQTTVNAAQGGDTVKAAILKLDSDLSSIFTVANTLDVTLATKVPVTEKGQANGVCPLGSDTKIASTYIPALTSAQFEAGVLVPVGAVIALLTNVVPEGFLEANGASISRTDYAALYAAWGTSFGAVDADHFNLPDLRGEFLRGWDHARGIDPEATSRTSRGDGTTGDNVGTKQMSRMQKHKHPCGSAVGTAGGGTGVVDHQGWDNMPYNYYTVDFQHTTDKNLGDLDTYEQTAIARGAETRPRNINVMYVIKYK